MKHQDVSANVFFRSLNKSITRSLEMPDYFYMMSDGSIFHMDGAGSLLREMDLSAIVGSDHKRLDHYEAESPPIQFFGPGANVFDDD